MQIASLPRPMAVTHSFQKAVAPDVAQMNFLFDQFIARFEPVMDSSYSLIRVNALYQQSVGELVSIDSTRAVTAFAGAVDTLPPNTAWLLQKRTALAGRAFRGRTYFPAVDQAAADDAGFLVQVFRDAYQLAANGWLFDIATVGTPVLIHSCFHAVTEPVCVAPAPTPTTSHVVDSRVATQRRRLQR